MDLKFCLGHALGDKYKNWRRAKNHLPPRYRLFFKFFSSKKDIIYAWFNDEFTLRKNGSKSDVYQVFKSLLEREEIQDSYQDLRRHSSDFS
jgi:toxin YhaV